MIKVGYSATSFKGDKYQAVITQLESEGFTNITTIDLEDSGFFKKRRYFNKSIVIDGESSFSASDYFDKDAKIVISHH